MEITITNCRYTPRWDTLERAVREATNDHDGVFTRISRKDGGSDYRALGEYELDFRTRDVVVPIQLTVS